MDLSESKMVQRKCITIEARARSVTPPFLRMGGGQAQEGEKKTKKRGLTVRHGISRDNEHVNDIDDELGLIRIINSLTLTILIGQTPRRGRGK
jgi:hypothetical protein